ncbi:hypothetical protein BJV74DRAFT_881593 [Russula compacta]|nr:hypothetical protein BJV74DRAFT_881593 [Russula compacta]
MVSDLYKACSDGDLNKVNQLLAQAPPLDIEEKDQDGVTPLIAAVKNGHRDVVKALLGHGANPAHASAHGLPEQYTSDVTVVELLRAAAIPKVNPDAPPQDPRFIHDPNVGPPKAYYMPHPGPYAYYPGIPVPPLPEGAMPYYPPPPAPPASSPPSADDQTPPSAGNNVSNLPPPEIARLIPCRYFPACRYGASCIFAHPQGPYYPGPMPPPAQYPSPYEQPPYAPNFYPIPAPPPQFQPPNGILPPHHLSSVSPQSATQPIPPPPPQFVHQRSTSEIVPPLQIPFNSSGAPVPAPGPYGPMSPVSPSYPHPSQLSVPLSVPPPPPAHASTPGPLSPTAPYPQPAPSSVAHQRYHASSEQNGTQKSPPQEGFVPRGDRRSSGGPGFRRPSFGGSRKPPCLFFPSGRCRNGDDCRFPHVLTDGQAVGRSSRFRPPPQNAVNGNSQANLEEKLGNLSITENGNHASRQGSSGSTTPSERGPRGANGTHVRPVKSTPAPPKQRVPNADEFPVLGGSSTPPQVNGNGHPTHTGPTAAQVLQAPAARKDPSKSDTPVIEGQEQFRPIAGQTTKTASQDATASTPAPVSALSHKLPVSFAAVANAAPDTSKEVAVSA